MILVKFRHKYRNYTAGETAAFDDIFAQHLIDSGTAELVREVKGSRSRQREQLLQGDAKQAQTGAGQEYMTK